MRTHTIFALRKWHASPFFAIVLALAIGGCAQPPKPPPPRTPQYTERITLLPSRDGRPSAVVVNRATGAQELSRPYESVELAGGREQRVQASESEVIGRYGQVLEAQPARPLTLTLFFVTGRTDLTAQSKAELAQVREKIRGFPAAQVSVIGHTDRVGTPEANDLLSLKRAAAIRDMLVALGIARDAIEIVGRGEREPLVQTADGKPEERNRRVEVKLR
ncbi:MAG TPA: OmpA family protein [Burkholderiales bacterium]|nr:OmpA family protein [Burkholderiales bacterium]